MNRKRFFFKEKLENLYSNWKMCEKSQNWRNFKREPFSTRRRRQSNKKSKVFEYSISIFFLFLTKAQTKIKMVRLPRGRSNVFDGVRTTGNDDRCLLPRRKPVLAVSTSDIMPGSSSNNGPWFIGAYPRIPDACCCYSDGDPAAKLKATKQNRTTMSYQMAL